MGPLRGDGNPISSRLASALLIAKRKWVPVEGTEIIRLWCHFLNLLVVEKMGPLRGDGNPCAALRLQNSM